MSRVREWKLVGVAKGEPPFLVSGPEIPATETLTVVSKTAYDAAVKLARQFREERDELRGEGSK